MTIPVLLFFYSVAIVLASLLGGWLPTVMQLDHTRTQLLMSYVAGLMLGIAFYHLLPHAIVTLAPAAGVDHAVWWLMIGLLLMFVLLRIFRFHQHGAAEDDGHDHNHAHHSGHQHDSAHSSPAQQRYGWLGVAFGLALHTFIDGIALGAAIQADVIEHEPLGLLGLGVFIAIVLHKPLDALSISTLMQVGGWSIRARTWVNLLFALMCPLGAYLFLASAGNMGDNSSFMVGSALAFSAGVFICISLSDLLPEIQFHSHDRGKLTLALILGVITAYAIGLVEPSASHHHDAAPTQLHHSAESPL